MGLYITGVVALNAWAYDWHRTSCRFRRYPSAVRAFWGDFGIIPLQAAPELTRNYLLRRFGGWIDDPSHAELASPIRAFLDLLAKALEEERDCFFTTGRFLFTDEEIEEIRKIAWERRRELSPRQREIFDLWWDHEHGGPPPGLVRRSGRRKPQGQLQKIQKSVILERLKAKWERWKAERKRRMVENATPREMKLLAEIALHSPETVSLDRMEAIEIRTNARDLYDVAFLLAWRDVLGLERLVFQPSFLKRLLRLEARLKAFEEAFYQDEHLFEEDFDIAFNRLIRFWEELPTHQPRNQRP